jgi:hypothetical protein
MVIGNVLSWVPRGWSIGFIVVTVCSACSTSVKPAPQTTAQEAVPAANPVPVAVALQHGIKFAAEENALPGKGIWKSTPALADINKDGHLDLAMLPRLGSGARVWFGDGKGGWREVSQGLELSESCGGGVVIADINNDEHLDLALADHCDGVFVYLGDGQGHWKATTKGLNPKVSRHKAFAKSEDNPFTGAENLAVGDVNEDGFPDLVVAASDEGGFTVYLGNGSGKKWRESANADGLPSLDDPEPGDQQRAGWANRVLLRDMNGDRHLDVIASYYRGPRVWLGDGKGAWQSASQGLPNPHVGGIFWEITAGDVNEDGRVDVAVGNTVNGVEVFLQNSDGSWQRTPDPLPELQGGAMGVTLADLDGDGHLDLFIGGQLTKVMEDRYGLFVLRGDGKGGWTRGASTSLPEKGVSFVWGTAAGDVNGDGKLDIAVAAGGSTSGRSPLPLPMSGAKNPPPLTQEQSSLPALQVWLNRSQK